MIQVTTYVPWGSVYEIQVTVKQREDSEGVTVDVLRLGYIFEAASAPIKAGHGVLSNKLQYL